MKVFLTQRRSSRDVLAERVTEKRRTRRAVLDAQLRRLEFDNRTGED
jgi:hypothetical protein